MTSQLFGQIEFSSGTFENGFEYPILLDKLDSSKYAVANSKILDGLADLEESAYCISSSGYVQKGSHIQVQVMCNCMEMEQSELRFFFINTDTGHPVKYSNMYEEKTREDAEKFVAQKLKKHYNESSADCSAAFSSLSGEPSTDDMDTRITKQGFEFRIPGSADCDSSPMRLSWSEMKDYLKYNFL
jgi:hypothetical protein